jgi:hypothetical protein
MTRLYSIPGRFSTQTQPGTAGCPAPPPCPACGGLECLCRPRFFAGQILTEADLNRLDQYVVNKNKLHNRYLHGWGVVCGMEVVCHPCGDRVTVRSGYAMSPCGDDIIICQDDTAPVCDLIRKCRPTTPTYPDCTPQTAINTNDCQGLVEDWILAVCYHETPARGMTPMLSASTGGRCSCGGSSAAGCGCGCGGSQASSNGGSSRSKTGCATAVRTAPAPCEPTLTCEGYTFIVYKAPPAQRGTGNTSGGGNTGIVGQANTSVGGQLANNVLACITNIFQNAPPLPENPSPLSLQQWCCAVKQWLTDLLNTESTGNCALFDLLANVRCPDAAGFTSLQDYEAALEPVIEVYLQVLGELLRECLCGALLPPCPPPVDCNCVPLATLKVRRGDCRVLRVCNWGARKFVLTFPDLIYWFEWTNLFEALRLWIEVLCCNPFPQMSFLLPATAGSAAGAAQPVPAGAPATRPASPGSATTTGVVGSTASPFARLLSQSWLNRDQIIDARTLAAAYLGFTDATGNPLAAPFGMANPAAYLTINQVLRPTLEATLPPELSQLLSSLATQANPSASTSKAAATAAPAAASSADELAALRQAVDELKASVKAQADEIAKLKKP